MLIDLLEHLCCVFAALPAPAPQQPPPVGHGSSAAVTAAGAGGESMLYWR